MIRLDFAAEFTEIVGERVGDLLRAAAWNWPAHCMPRNAEHEREGRGNECFQGKKRMSSNPREERTGWFVLE